MSSSSTTKTKPTKDKVSMIKLAKSNQLSNDMHGLKISLGDVIKDYDPKMKVAYQDAIPSKTRLPKDDERIHCPVIILVLESVQKQIVKALLWKHFPLNGEAFPIVLSFGEKYLTLNSLKFEDACLKEADVILLGAFLRTNCNITDLNLSGNIYNKSFICLIQDTKLKYLSLKFCSINHVDLEEFVEPLKDAYRMPLVHLNLSNNNIGDAGARVIADMLRVNRVLISLNIAANYITDEGAKEILRSLQMFNLNQEEISIRRKIYYEYYMQKYHEIMSNSSPEACEEEKIMISRSSSMSASRLKNKTKTMKNRGRKSVASLSEMSFNTARETSPTCETTPTVALPFAESSDLVATLDFQSAYHPFVKDTTPNGFQFFCRGNFVLTHLNLSFNQLTTSTLKDLQDVLKYQLSSGSTEEGLKGVSVHGNDMKSEETENLQNDLGEMFTMKTSRSASCVTVSSKDMTKKAKKVSK